MNITNRADYAFMASPNIHRDSADKRWLRARRIDTSLRIAALVGFWLVVAGLAWVVWV